MPNLFLRLLLVSVGLAAGVVRLHAMSVVPPTFDQLVAASDLVARGVVTEIRCVGVDTSQGPAIRTLVTLRIERTLKGNASGEVTLSFLGGQLGGRTLTVVGMPTFHVGDRQIVFVGNNGRALCPLIAAGHGRYHVEHDPRSGEDRVMRDNHTPLISTEEVARPLAEAGSGSAAAATGDPLSLAAFEAKITAAVRRTETVVQP